MTAILKMATGRHFLMSVIKSGHHYLPTYQILMISDNHYLPTYQVLNICSIVVAILKMATGRIFSMSGIISGHHNLPTYEMSLKSDNVECVRYCGGHFENGDR